MSSSFRITRTLLTNTTRKSSITTARSRLGPQKNFATKHNTTFSTPTRQPVPSTRSFSTTNIRMGVHNIASKAQFSEALKNEVVVLDCFATWCGPCKVIAPQVVKFSDDFPSAHFIKVDVDEVPDVAQELGIRAMPTFIIFKGGEKVDEIVGANPPALKAAIEKAVAA